MTTLNERTYDKIIWALFEAAHAGALADKGAVHTLLDRETMGAKMLGWTEAAHRLEAAAGRWRAKRKTCPFCGGTLPCPTTP